MYLPNKYVLPFEIYGVDSLWISPVQIHSFIIAVFSSIIAPFGGFFASGFKRAFKIKDFGNTIPGHGGITDRFDCHIVMVMFTFVYLHQIVFRINPTAEGVINMFNRLLPDEQRQVLLELGCSPFVG